jgi:iron complex outermembrane recepter protein
VTNGSVPFTPIGSTGPADGRCFSLNANNVPGGVLFTDTLRENNLSWRSGVDYKVAANSLLYANISRGYKAGSFPILAAATTSQFQPVTQESVTAYEGGLKTELFDRKAQFNSAVFYYQYRNKQVLTKVVDPIFGILDKLQNIPRSRVYGAEGELVVKPFAGMTLGASLTYLNAKITEYTGVDYVGDTRNFGGRALPFAPQWNYSLNADYRHGMSNGGVSFVGVSLDGHSSSSTIPGGDTITLPPAPATRILPGLVYPFRTDAHATVDARVGYEASSGRWRVMLWGKNILNEYYWTNVVTASDFSARYAGLPATYGVTVGFKMD